MNVHRANSYVAVTPPANATMGLGELRLQGTDENGLVYLAIARVSVKGSGFATRQACSSSTKET